jgi:hypothetical protein
MCSATLQPGGLEQVCVSRNYEQEALVRPFLSQSIQRFYEPPDWISVTFSTHLETFTKTLIYSQ